MKYRIRPVTPDVYIVEKKRWYGLYTCLFYDYSYIDDYEKTFSSVEEAKRDLFDYVKLQEQIKKHLAQPSLYLEG